jgi:FlaA1/EpsC-like NDP-sugar epimerase
MLEGRVLLTGGSGFLGRGILRRASAENWSAHFIVYSRDEYKQALCKRKYPDAQYVIGDIRDLDRLRLTMLGVNTVIHTAAFKYVPEGEINVSECISINISGTQTVLMAAQSAGVPCAVVISTDKAVKPVNVYGMTKALAERAMVEMSAYDTIKCTGVRYGNVIGSTGSVIPVLMDQAARKGVVTLTDPLMTRFWITIDEAIDLILTALDGATMNGSIIIPEPQSLTLRALVDAILPDVKKHIVGPRLGEKTHEELITEYESLWAWPTAADEGSYELYSPQNRPQPQEETFLLSSEFATPMPAKDFLAAVEDAQNV